MRLYISDALKIYFMEMDRTQPGRKHAEASSSVTWLFMLVVVGWLGFNIIISAKVLGVLCGAVSLILIHKIMETFTDEMPWVMVPTFLMLVTPPFIMWNQMGLKQPCIR